MTPEFDHARAAFAASTPGRALAGVTRAIASAWRTSRVGRVRNIAGTLRLAPAPLLIRHIALAVAAAAGLQPLLIWVMPRTVRPGIPAAAFVAIALVAAAAASAPDAIAASWPGSRFGRWLRR
jgi:hypothetical protein